MWRALHRCLARLISSEVRQGRGDEICPIPAKEGGWRPQRLVGQGASAIQAANKAHFHMPAVFFTVFRACWNFVAKCRKRTNLQRRPLTSEGDSRPVRYTVDDVHQSRNGCGVRAWGINLGEGIRGIGITQVTNKKKKMLHLAASVFWLPPIA